MRDVLKLELSDFGLNFEAKTDLHPFSVHIGPGRAGRPCLAAPIHALHWNLS